MSTICECAVGSQLGTIDRCDCVYCNVSIYDLCIALFDGLVERVLVELEAILRSTQYVYDGGINDKLMTNIKLVITAAGLTPSNSKGTLKDVLSDFTFGA